MQISAMLSLGGTYYIVLCNKQTKKNNKKKQTNQFSQCSQNPAVGPLFYMWIW